MFNTPYLFIGLVLDNLPNTPSEFSFLRPNGAYFTKASKRQDLSKILKNENYDIKVYFLSDDDVFLAFFKCLLLFDE